MLEAEPPRWSFPSWASDHIGASAADQLVADVFVACVTTMAVDELKGIWSETLVLQPIHLVNFTQTNQPQR